MGIRAVRASNLPAEYVIFDTGIKGNNTRIVILGPYNQHDFAVMCDTTAYEGWRGWACDRTTMARIAYKYRNLINDDSTISVAAGFFKDYFTEVEWTLAALECLC